MKNRLSLTLFSWMFCFNSCYYYKETVLFVLVNSSNSFLELTGKPYFIVTNVTEIFYVYFELTLFVSNQTAVVILVHQIFMFLSLGLYRFEFVKLKLLFKLLIISWAFSFILLFKFVVPFSWKFFLSFQDSSTNGQSISLFFEAKMNEYLQYFVRLYYICLASCQFLALLTVILTSLSKRLKAVRTFRRLFYLTFVVFSTIITPPDILSQLCVCSVLIFTYEFMIFLKGIKVSMVTN